MAEGPLIKCDCPDCDCDQATADGVCYECARGLHVRDREMEGLRKPETPDEQAKRIKQ